MKKIFIALLAAGCLVACTSKKTAYEQYTELYDNVVAQLETVEDRAAKDSIIDNFVTEGYTLLLENVQDVTSDSIVLNIFYMLSPEQKAELFAAIPAERLQMPVLEPVYKEYQIELKTSAGNPYIDITSLKADGSALSLSELVGKTDYLLVDFWASWCGPCRRLIPVLKDVYASQPKGRLQILSCSCDRDEDAWRQALEEEQMPWPQMREDENYICNDKYGVVGIPTTILIDKEGMIIARNPDEAELEAILWGE